MDATTTDPVGFLGFGAGARPLGLAPADFRGWAAGQATNTLIHLLPPPGAGAVRGPLTLTLTYGGAAHALTYDPAAGVVTFDPAAPLARRLPEATPVVLTVASLWYQPVRQELSVGPGTVQAVAVPLAFAQAYALVSRRRYR